MSEKNTIYRGKATIMNIGAEELTEKMLEKLPEGDRETALMLVFDVQTAEADPRRFEELPNETLEIILANAPKFPAITEAHRAAIVAVLTEREEEG